MREVRIFLALAVTLALTALVPAAAVAAGSTTTTSATAVAGGWGKNTSTYIGTFKLVPGAAASTQGTTVSAPAAGVFSLAVRTAAQLTAASGPVSSGQLVTFLRKVKTGEPLAPSGILSVFGSSGSEVLYLTDLALHGTKRVATVNGGSFLGVPIGTFTATPASGDDLNAVITATGLGSVPVRLTDFAAAPPSS